MADGDDWQSGAIVADAPPPAQSATPQATPAPAYTETPIDPNQAQALMSQPKGPAPYGLSADQAQAWEATPNPKAQFAAPNTYIRVDPDTGQHYLRTAVPPSSSSASATAPTSDGGSWQDGQVIGSTDTMGGGDPGSPQGIVPQFLRSTDATVRGLANAVTFGGADRLAAASEALPALFKGGPSALGPAFSQAMDAQQQRDAADRRDVPGAAYSGQIAGTVGTAAALPEVPAATFLGRAAVGAGQGALLSGLDAFGNARGNIGQMSQAAAMPMVTGAAGGAVLGGLLGARPIPKVSPTADFERLGIDPLLAVSGGKGTQQLSQMLAGNPMMGAPLRQAASRTLQQGQNAAERIAGTYGIASTPFEAGGALQRGAQAGVNTMRGTATKIYAPLNALDRSTATVPASNTATTLNDVFSRYTTPGVKSWFRQNAPKLAELQGTLASTGATPRITFSEMKALRSDLGSMLEDHTINPVDQANLKRVYGAMTQDYYNAAETLGGAKARTAAVRGDAYYAALRKRVADSLDTVLKANSPEQAFERVKAMAGSTARADIRQLETIRKSVPPEAWGDVAAGVLRNMGKGENGAFSLAKLATNWSKLSVSGRKALFGGARYMGNDEQLTALMNVAAKTQAASKFYNASQSGNHLITALMLEEPVRAAFSGKFEDVPAIGALAAMGYGASWLLSSPGFARLALGATRAADAASQAAMSSRLGAYALEHPDLASHITAFRRDWLSRIRANAPVTTLPALSARGQQSQRQGLR